MPDPDALPTRLAVVLRFEARHAGWVDAALEPAVRQAFGIGLLRYRQRLHAAVKHPAAEAFDAATVRRLRRLLEARTRRLHPIRRGA